MIINKKMAKAREKPFKAFILDTLELPKIRESVPLSGFFDTIQDGDAAVCGRDGGQVPLSGFSATVQDGDAAVCGRDCGEPGRGEGAPQEGDQGHHRRGQWIINYLRPR